MIFMPLEPLASEAIQVHSMRGVRQLVNLVRSGRDL